MERALSLSVFLSLSLCLSLSPCLSLSLSVFLSPSLSLSLSLSPCLSLSLPLSLSFSLSFSLSLCLSLSLFLSPSLSHTHRLSMLVGRGTSRSVLWGKVNSYLCRHVCGGCRFRYASVCVCVSLNQTRTQRNDLQIIKLRMLPSRLYSLPNHIPQIEQFRNSVTRLKATKNFLCAKQDQKQQFQTARKQLRDAIFHFAYLQHQMQNAVAPYPIQ